MRKIKNGSVKLEIVVISRSFDLSFQNCWDRMIDDDQR